MKNYLLLTLGHNSSAIFVDNSNPEHQEIIGYEQERLSGIKADSQFPRDAINEIAKHVDANKLNGCKVLISHWFNFVQNALPNKYITENDLQYLHLMFGDDIVMCNKDFTHHDAHAYSAYEFFKYYQPNYEIQKPTMCLVVDGFGNNEEVLSLYSTDPVKGIHLVHRVYGYKVSLGLMYQYATAFTGMKENQDEYKFLGYEAYIDEYFNTEQIDAIDHLVETTKECLIKAFDNNTSPSAIFPSNEVIDFAYLEEVREQWYEKFTEVCVAVDISNEDESKSFKGRVAIAYFIQQLCERTLISWLNSKYQPENLIVAGGVFYNVKLNQALAENCAKNSFSVVPLAGDQGAAIGMYAKDCDRQFEFGDLCWGKRSLYNAEKLINQNKLSDRILFVDTDKTDKQSLYAAVDVISKMIADNNIINLVYNNMEFGPRALCHTSTLFLPTSDNTSANNAMNGRNEVMPCAPVCTAENALKLFSGHDLLKITGSDKYMICTHTYIKPFSRHYGGIMHKRPLEQSFTGRPQVVIPDEFMYDILKAVEAKTDYEALVNTSFNVHGRPIAFDIISILQNFEYQFEHAIDGKEPYLVIINAK